MALEDQEKLDRIGGAFYRKIMGMKTVEAFTTWVSTLTPQGLTEFIKSALQEAIDGDNEYLIELAKIKKDIGS